MLSRNNSKLIRQKFGKQHQRFGIKKLSIGVASLLLGTTFFLTNSNVEASVGEQSTSTTSTTEITQEDSSSQGSLKLLLSSQTSSATNPASQSSQTAKSQAPSASGSTATTSSAASQSASAASSAAKSTAATTTSAAGHTSQASSAASSTSSRKHQGPAASNDEVSATQHQTSTSQQTSSAATDETSANQTFTIPTSHGNSISSDEIGVELMHTSDARITDAGSEAVTLTHGQQDPHYLSLSVIASGTDHVRVTVPSIFTANADSQPSQGVNVTVSHNASDSAAATTFNYTFTRPNRQSYNLNLVLTPTIANWGLLPAGSQYQVHVYKNDSEAANLTYTIDQPALITGSHVLVDPTQHTNLVRGQKYIIAVNLPNTGVNDGDNFKGTITIQVPTGFVLDGAGAYGLSYPSEFGNIDRVFPNGISAISQSGGAGTPITISFDNGKAYLNSNYMTFWGTYTQPISATSNHFQVAVDYQTERGGRLEPTTHHYAGSPIDINLPVTSADRSQMTSSISVGQQNGRNAVGLDAIESGTTYRSDDSQYHYPGGIAVSVANNGNIVQTNVKLHVNVEPGTVFNKDGIVFQGTGENNGITVIANLTDGSHVTLLNDHRAGVNANGDIAPLSADTTAPDGTNIQSLDITFDKIYPGSSTNIGFSKGSSTESVTQSSKGSILNTATRKHAGDTVSYSYTLTSDQGMNQSGSQSAIIVDPTTALLRFEGYNESFVNGTYDKTSTGSTIHTSGQITYMLTHDREDDSRPSSYLIVVPAGFHVASEMKVMYQSHVLPESEAAKTATITSLGAVGPAGEYVYRIDMSFTPGEFGQEAYVQTDNNVPLTLAINDQQGPASYQYGHNFGYPTGVALEMEINGNNSLEPDGANQAADFRSITLAGHTYPVMPAANGWHEGFSDATYNFLAPSMYGTTSGVRNDREEGYQESSNTAAQAPAANFAFSNNSNGIPTTSTSNGNIRLTNIMTDGGTSRYAYNVINLPSVANGQSVTLQLTGPGSLMSSGVSSHTQLLYSTNPLTKTSNLTAADLSSYVPANQVSDWSTIRSILLESDPLTNGSIENAYLPFKVAAMQDGLNSANVQLNNIFTGDHNGQTFNSHLVMNVHADRYVQLTTRWVKQNSDHSQTDIIPATTTNVEAGWTYQTHELPLSQVPAGYALDSVTGNANGIAPADNFTVTYVYTQQAQDSTLSFIDEDNHNQRVLPDITVSGQPDTNINFVSHYSGDHVGQNNMTPSQLISYLQGQGYVVDNEESTYHDGSDYHFGTTASHYVIALKHQVVSKTETRTATRKIYYVQQGTSGIPDHWTQFTSAELGGQSNPVTQTVTFTGTGYYDQVQKQYVQSPTNLTLQEPSLTTSGSFAAVSSPAINGFTVTAIDNTNGTANTTDVGENHNINSRTPAVPTGASDIDNVYVIYSRNVQSTLSFEDEDNSNQKVLPDINASGLPRTNINFLSDYTGPFATQTHKTPAELIAYLQGRGYVVDITNSTYDVGSTYQYGNTATNYVIYLKHKVDQISDTRTITRNIYYVQQGTSGTPDHWTQFTSAELAGHSNPVTQTVTFHGTGYYDKVQQKYVQSATNVLPSDTQELTWTHSGSFAAVNSPAINGFTILGIENANGTANTNDAGENYSIISRTPAIPNTANEIDNVYVVYNRIGQAKLNFLDDDAAQSSIHPALTASGRSSTGISFDNLPGVLNQLHNQGYVLVEIDSDGTEPTFTRALPGETKLNGNHFTDHDWSTVFGQYDNEQGTTQIFNLHFVHSAVAKTARGTANRTVHFVENNQHGAELQSPTVQTVDFRSPYYVDATKSGNTPIAITTTEDVYGNQQTVLDPLHTAPGYNWTVSGTPTSFAAVTTPISFPAENGGSWHLTNSVTEVTPTSPTDTNAYMIYQYQAPTPTTRQVSQTKTVKEVIHYVYGETHTTASPDHIATLKFDRTGTQTIATGAINWEPWKPEDSANSGTFAEVPSPEINNYTASQLTVPPKVVNLRLLSDDDPVIEITVTYTPNKKLISDSKTVTETIHYQFTDGRQAAPDHTVSARFTRTGTQNEATGVETWNAWAPASQSFDPVVSPTIVHYTPDQTSVALPTATPTSDNWSHTVTYRATETGLTDHKTITETIHYQFDDGSEAAPTYQRYVTYSRTGNRNEVSGAETWNAWTPAGRQRFTAVTSPTVTGYTPDQSSIVEQVVDPTSSDLTFTVTYSQKSQPTQPTQASQQTQLTTPSNPTSSTQPTTPTEPTNPTLPTQPTQVTQQTEPSSPTSPTALTQPLTPTSPTQPSENPNQPTQPGQPSTAPSKVELSHTGQEAVPVPEQRQPKLSAEMKQPTEKKLPQTGNEKRSGILGLGLASLIATLGLGIRSKRDHD